MKNINTGLYKWTYTDNAFTEEYVKHIIRSKIITLTTNDFNRVDEGVFRKIRNGLNNRSPLKQNTKYKKMNKSSSSLVRILQ